MFKVNNKYTRTRCEICLKLNMFKSGVFIVNFEHVSLCSSVSIVNFEQVNADSDTPHEMTKI